MMNFGKYAVKRAARPMLERIAELRNMQEI